MNPLEGLRIAAAILQAGYPLLIFPEGTRSVTGKLFEPEAQTLFLFTLPYLTERLRGNSKG